MLKSKISLIPLGLYVLVSSAHAQSTTAGTVKPKPQPIVATSRAVSMATILISKSIGGQIVSCPKALKTSQQAICLYSKSSADTLKPNIRSGLGDLVLGDWKAGTRSSSILISEVPNGAVAAYALLSPLGATESLVIIDEVAVKAAPAPAGVVKGQPYILGKDLIGIVNVIDLGDSKYRLNVAGKTAITVSAGSKTAQKAGGNVELSLAPATDGKNLIFPLDGVKALGCAVSESANSGFFTISCGSDSVGVRPIIF